MSFIFLFRCIQALDKQGVQKKFANTPDKDNSMREMSKFYYYVGKKLADLKKICEKGTDENQSIDEGSEDIVDDSQMNDKNAMPRNSDNKKKKHRNSRTINNKTTCE